VSNVVHKRIAFAICTLQRDGSPKQTACLRQLHMMHLAKRRKLAVTRMIKTLSSFGKLFEICGIWEDSVNVSLDNRSLRFY